MIILAKSQPPIANSHLLPLLPPCGRPDRRVWRERGWPMGQACGLRDRTLAVGGLAISDWLLAEKSS